MIDKELIAAYRAAKYVVYINEKPLELRVGATCAELVPMIAASDSNFAAFITPFNPYSEQLSVRENGLRYERLIEILSSQNYPHFCGYGVDDQGEWPQEESLLILDLTAEKADAIASEFGQNAYLRIDESGVISLWSQRSNGDNNTKTYGGE